MSSSSTQSLPQDSLILKLQKLRIEAVAGPDQGRHYEGLPERAQVGTGQRNDFVLTDPAVSRHHFEVVLRPEGIILLRDLDSTNGTRLEGVRVQEAIIESGMHLEIGRTRLRFELLADEAEVELAHENRFGGLVGTSAAMRRVFALLGKVAPRDTTVLLTGESGTGKELATRALHDHSPRAAGPFVTVDCGAMPATLIESQLFGHEKGAFTGAVQSRAGAFERADGGTLMLDEIGELPLELQPKLLRVLESREFVKLGGSGPRKVDVRIVAATNRDLRTEVNRQTFRGDLYYRLSVVEIRLPPVRERLEDIPLLVEQFLDYFTEHDGGLVKYCLASDAMEYLFRHRWPGNVRELRNFVERSISLADGRLLMSDPVELSLALSQAGATLEPNADTEASTLAPQALDPLPFAAARRLVNDEFERNYLKRLLARTGGVVARAAREAEMDRSHLNELLKKHRLR